VSVKGVYPTAPLIEALGDLPDRTAAELLGINRDSLIRWRSPGATTTAAYADRYAIALGVHPAELWPSWIDDFAGPMRHRPRLGQPARS
jgi:hypothetical protein